MHPLFRLFGKTMAVGAVLVICSAGYLAWGQTTTRSGIKSTHRLQSRDTATNFCQISGWVVDETKLPFIGAKVMVRRRKKVIDSAVCNYDGYFCIKPLQPGTYSVFFFSEQYATWHKKVRLIADSINVNAELEIDPKKYVPCSIGPLPPGKGRKRKKN